MVNVKLDEFKRINKDGNVMLLCYDVEKVQTHKVKKRTHTHTQSQTSKNKNAHAQNKMKSSEIVSQSLIV